MYFEIKRGNKTAMPLCGPQIIYFLNPQVNSDMVGYAMVAFTVQLQYILFCFPSQIIETKVFHFSIYSNSKKKITIK